MGPLSLKMFPQKSSLAVYPGDSRAIRSYKLGSCGGDTEINLPDFDFVPDIIPEPDEPATIAALATMSVSNASETSVMNSADANVLANATDVAASTSASVAEVHACTKPKHERTGHEPTDLAFKGSKFVDFNLPNGDRIRYERVYNF